MQKTSKSKQRKSKQPTVSEVEVEVERIARALDEMPARAEIEAHDQAWFDKGIPKGPEACIIGIAIGAMLKQGVTPELIGEFALSAAKKIQDIVKRYMTDA